MVFKKDYQPKTISKSWLTRITRLADIIFATSMTMLLLAIDLPEVGDIKSNKQLLSAFSNQLPILGIFLSTFVLLAVYWLKHTVTTRLMKGADTVYMWLDLLMLAFVALLPFSNGLATAFPDYFVAIAAYSINVIIIGLLSFSAWKHVSFNNRLLKNPVDPLDNKEISEGLWMEPLLAFISLILGYVAIEYAQVPYTLVPIAFWLQTKWAEKRNSAR
nr:TMEM175 family protein [Flammeovirga sp. SubArs3]